MKLPFAISIVGLALVLGGCTYLPSSGPSSARIRFDSTDPDSYRLVPITRRVIGAINAGGRADPQTGWSALDPSEPARPRDASVHFRTSSPGVNNLPSAGRQTISVGDVVNVTIYETGGALFGSPDPTRTSGAASSQIPPQIVDESGEITVPFAGRIRVTGRSFHAVESAIAEKLEGKAIDPQIIVTVAERKGDNLVTVMGDVKSPREIPLGFGRTRLLDAVTAAGGSAAKAHETKVTVIRGSLMRSDALSGVVSSPSKNVALQAGDTVVVKAQPRTYLAFGATGKNGRFGFDSDSVSLAEAVATAGGPLDARANPAALYVYRLEPSSLVEDIGRAPAEGDTTPVIYSLDLTSPEGFFLAQSFDVEDKDIIFFANAGSVGLSKFLGLLGTVTGSARGGISTATGF